MSLPITLIFVCPKPKQTDAYSLGQHSTTATIQQHALLQFYCRRSPGSAVAKANSVLGYARVSVSNSQINHTGCKISSDMIWLSPSMIIFDSCYTL